MDEAPFVEFQNTPIPEAHIYLNPADQVEANELLNELKRDPRWAATDQANPRP
jgi:hypothetical protein